MVRPNMRTTKSSILSLYSGTMAVKIFSLPLEMSQQFSLEANNKHTHTRINIMCFGLPSDEGEKTHKPTCSCVGPEILRKMIFLIETKSAIITLHYQQPHFKVA